MSKSKRLVVISDLHCGHRSGLTPPAYQYQSGEGDSIRDKYARFQSEMWTWYCETLKGLRPIDVLVVNGDAIEGKGELSGGSENIEDDRSHQIEIAQTCIEQTKAKQMFFVYGTPRHTGKEEDWEAILAERFNSQIKSHLFLDVAGVVFDLKHKVGASTIPHGRATAPLREALWNALWAERGLQPRAKVLIRSHVHYCVFAGDSTGLAITTPALQGPGSKFGARMCSGTIDVGLISFDCCEKDFSWELHEFDFRFAAEKAIVV